MKIVKLVGILFVVFGIVDLIGSYTGFDLWGTLGIKLPDLLWQYSHFIAIGIGAVLFSIGSAGDDDEESA